MSSSACACSTTHWSIVASLVYVFSHKIIIAQLLVYSPGNLKNFIFAKI